MDMIRPEQYVTLALFLAVLVLVWGFVRLNRGGLAQRLRTGSRLRLVEVAALSPADRAMLVEADGQAFLLIRCKGTAPLLHPLGPAQGDTP